MERSKFGERSRRRFLGSSLGTAVDLATNAKGEGENEYAGLLQELSEILESNDYDTAKDGCSLLVVISDPHIFLGPDYPALLTQSWEDDLIDEINALCPLVSHLIIAGDLISYHSMTPGAPRAPWREQLALQEYALAKEEVKRFQMPLWMVPGNHDTDAYEVDAEMFQAQMGVPPYQRIELGGVSLLLLNTGNAGMLNPAQELWLRVEARTIPPDKEVLIIQHIPTFFTVYTQAGSKRIIAEAFSHRTAPVYLVSGHHHRFLEDVSEYNGTKFVQMATTTANRVVFNDKKNPGYMLLGLQDGMVKSRIQRSLTVGGFWPLPPLSELPAQPVRFPFDEVVDLICSFEEGFYESDEHIEYTGVHVGCYIAYCRSVLLRVNPGKFYGCIRRLVVSGIFIDSTRPDCLLSRNGKEGDWEELVFPPAIGSGSYAIDLPEDVAGLEEFFIKLDSNLVSPVQGFSFSGWALASNASSLSGYERWLSELYGTLIKNDENAPHAIVKGGDFENILTFAFNLPPYQRGGITGLPEIGSGDDGHALITYVRVRDWVFAGLEYSLECSADGEVWKVVEPESYQSEVIQEDEFFERLGVSLPLNNFGAWAFFRIGVQAVGS